MPKENTSTYRSKFNIKKPKTPSNNKVNKRRYNVLQNNGE
jgi:hypothetical protein